MTRILTADRAKSQSEQEKSLSWRFGPQRSETFSRVAYVLVQEDISSVHRLEVLAEIPDAMVVAIVDTTPPSISQPSQGSFLEFHSPYAM